MADEDDVDVEGDFDVKIESAIDFAFDTNEPPSRTVHLQPEFTHHPWMLEQGWSLDNCTDEKSKATIEKMLLEEQYYLNGHLQPGKGSKKPVHAHPAMMKRTWTQEEKELFVRGMEIHGRSWTKISEIIQTRTPLQVKNYAQQYFKQAKFPKTKHLASAAVSQPSQSLEGTLISVTTAQPTVKLSSVKQSPVKPLVKLRGGKSPLKPKFKKMAKKTEQGGTGEKGNVEVKKLIACDPTVKRIEKISDDEDVEIDVEFDDDSSSDRGAEKHMSGSGNKIVSAEQSPYFGESSYSQPDEEISLPPTESGSVISPSKDTLASEDTSSVPESKESSEVVPLNQGIVGSEKSVVQNELAGQLVVEAKQGMETAAAAEDGCSEKVEKDDLTDYGPAKEHLLDSEEPPFTSTSTIENVQSVNENVGCKPSTSAMTDEQTEHCEKWETAGVVICNENDRSDNRQDLTYLPEGSMDQAVVIEGESSSLEDKVPMEDTGAGDSSADDSVEEEGKDDSSKEEEEENLCGGYILTSSGEGVFLPPPTEEFKAERDAILEQEREIHSEFFLGRPMKTAERYLKIRNYIIDAWLKCKPEYLNKTSIRPGLRNCGDVNSIGRIHAYLEQIGAINFGCEQTNYYKRMRPPPPVNSKQKKSDSKSGREDSVKSRKRRVRDAFGEWIDESELEGRTIEHKSQSAGEQQSSSGTRARTPKIRKNTYWYDPFKLLPCEPFRSGLPAPFLLDISCSAMAVMDVHAHMSKTEVIGLLGGHYNRDKGALQILTAEPCNSISTGMQCEMDPVSQTQAMDRITTDGYSVVGWYHSHPTFAPNPSVRDIETQEKFQDWFSQGGLPFIGVIVNPYDKASQSPCSIFKCLMVRKEKHPEAECYSPYQFEYQIIQPGISLGQLLIKLRDLIQMSAKSAHRVEMLRLYKRTSDVSCLEKMLLSMKYYLRNQIKNMDKLMAVLRDLSTENFSEGTVDS